MFDNIAVDNTGHILLQEDVGNNAHIGKIWQYTIGNGELKTVAQHDSLRFKSGAPLFLTQDEESSGIIDASSILGPGMLLSVVQAHYAVPGEFVEGGQLLAMFNPGSVASDYDDRVLVCHNGSSILVPGNMVLTHLGHGDQLGYCELMTSALRNSASQNFQKSGLTLYPNPASSRATVLINLPEAGKVSITVHDANGAQVVPIINSNYKAGVQTINLNTSGLRNGTYIVRVVTSKGTNNIKLVVLH
jgi:hypothetical protein